MPAAAAVTLLVLVMIIKNHALFFVFSPVAAMTMTKMVMGVQ
jgi:hypothetical protein